MATKLLKALRSHSKQNNGESEDHLEIHGMIGTAGVTNNKKPNKKSQNPGTPTDEQCRLWKENFENVLNDPKGTWHFKVLLNKELAGENYDFYNAVKEIKQQKPQGEKLKKECKKIFNHFINEQGPTPINVNGKLRSALTEAIDEPTLEIFDNAQRHVFNLMKDGTYKRFVEQYLQQLIKQGKGNG